MKQKKMNQFKGFTLVELLIVIVLIASISTIAGNILLIALRSASKTTTSTIVRQSGNYVTQQIAEEIRYARNFIGVSADNISYTNICTTASLTPTPTPMNYHYLKLTTGNNDIVTYSCDASSTVPSNTSSIASNGAALIDVNAVSVMNCTFTCTQASITSPPTIGISLTLTQKASGNGSENLASYTFNRTTVLRNNNL